MTPDIPADDDSAADPTVADFRRLAEIADVVEGRADPDTSAEVAQLLNDDSEARATALWLSGFVDATLEIPASPGSALLRQNLRQYFERWARAQEMLAAPVRRYRATLLFDSSQDRPLLAVRGADEAESTQLMLHSEVGDLVLDVRADEDERNRITGQIMLTEPTDAPIFAVRVSRDGRSLDVVESDELGRFRLLEVPADRIELQVANGEVEIVAELDLSSPSGT